MWTISNDKRIDNDEIKYLPVKYNIKKPKNISDNNFILEKPYCRIKSSLRSPNKCNDNVNDHFKVKQLSVKSDDDKPQIISKNVKRLCQIRCRAGASLGRSRNHNSLQQKNRTRSECQFNVNSFCDDKRKNEYANSKRKSRPLEKMHWKPKRSIVDKVEGDLQIVHQPENDTDEQQWQRYKVREWTRPKLYTYDYKNNYYDNETGICDWKENRDMQNHNWNKQIVQQQTYLDFRPYVDEFPLLNEEKPEENRLTIQQEKQIPRREERKSRCKELNSRQENQQLTNMWRTEEELDRVKIQRLQLLRCIEHHQRALTTETKQLLKNQHRQQRLRRDNENERLEELRWIMGSQYSQQEKDTTQKKQDDFAPLVGEYNESTPQTYIRNKLTEKNLSMAPKKPQWPINNADRSNDVQQQQKVHRYTTAKAKVSKPHVLPQRLDSASINTYDDCLTSVTSTFMNTNAIRGKAGAGVDDMSSLPLQHGIKCNCIIDVPNDIAQRTMGPKPAVFIKDNDRYRQSRYKTGTNQSINTNNSTGCAE